MHLAPVNKAGIASSKDRDNILHAQGSLESSAMTGDMAKMTASPLVCRPSNRSALCMIASRRVCLPNLVERVVPVLTKTNYHTLSSTTGRALRCHLNLEASPHAIPKIVWGRVKVHAHMHADIEDVGVGQTSPRLCCLGTAFSSNQLHQAPADRPPWYPRVQRLPSPAKHMPASHLKDAVVRYPTGASAMTVALSLIAVMLNTGADV